MEYDDSSARQGEGCLNFKNILRYISAAAVLAAAAYFFYVQFKDNADALNAYDFSLNIGYVCISLMLGSISLMVGPIVWRMFVNDYLRNKLNFAEGYVLYCASAMFKYVPGKIWTYAAQIALMSSKGISKVVLFYINLVSVLCMFFVSAIISLFYYLFYVNVTTWAMALLIFGLVILVDFIFIAWHNTIINYLIRPVNNLIKLEIKPIKTRNMILVYTQLFYLAACAMLGMSLFFLGLGINMEMSFSNIFAFVATISISMILSLLAFFTVGGLGVREGAMYFMLKQFSNIETALILPVVARFLTILGELIMLTIAIIIGIRYGYFAGLGKTINRG